MSDADDLLEKAGGFFAKLGSSLKHSAKQVTGIGRGTARLELARTRVAPGDALAGSVVLALPEPVDAKRLVVTLAASQRTIGYELRDGLRSAVASRNTIYTLDRELGGAATYASGATAFELAVPPDALDKHAPAGSHPIADAVRSVASVLSPQLGPVEWSVTARLEIAWGRDLRHTVDITVAR